MSEPKIVAECWTCAWESKISQRRSGCLFNSTGWTQHARDCQHSPYGIGTQERLEFHRAAGHDVRPVEVKPVHVSAGPTEPVGYVRCLPSGAVHPAGDCHERKGAPAAAREGDE